MMDAVAICIAATGPLVVDVPHAGTHGADRDRRAPDARGARVARHRLARREALRVRARARARRCCARRIRATSSISIAIRRARRSTRAPTTPSSARRARSPTSRSTRRATAPTPRRGDAAHRDAISTPYHAGARGGDRARARAPRLRDRCSTGIRFASEVPRFFAGRLPDLNLGTANGASCAPELQAAARRVLAPAPRASRTSSTAASRAAGSRATTGGPHDGVHALQLEMAQRCYMDEAPPYPWDAGARRAAGATCCGDSSRARRSGGPRA